MAINTISKTIETTDGQERFPGRPTAGFGGWAIQDLAVQTVEVLCRVREELGAEYRIIGVGGITESSGAQRYLNAGADVVEAGHSAIWNPYLAYQVGKALWNE